MGIGQIVTLEVPAAKLRDVNLAIEKTAWKAFRTEFYPTYDDYLIVRDKLANKSRSRCEPRRNSPALTSEWHPHRKISGMTRKNSRSFGNRP